MKNEMKVLCVVIAVAFVLVGLFVGLGGFFQSKSQKSTGMPKTGMLHQQFGIFYPLFRIL